LARRGYRFVGPATERPRESATATAVTAVDPAARSRLRFGNLPEVLPPLFGRSEDVAAICALIDEHRVISIVGAGGIGKTSLAQAVAHRRRHDFADGSWMVELASSGMSSAQASGSRRRARNRESATFTSSAAAQLVAGDSG
jgi:ABC-type glutathione transport system ATPase component